MANQRVKRNYGFILQVGEAFETLSWCRKWEGVNQKEGKEKERYRKGQKEADKGKDSIYRPEIELKWLEYLITLIHDITKMHILFIRSWCDHICSREKILRKSYSLAELKPLSHCRFIKNSFSQNGIKNEIHFFQMKIVLSGPFFFQIRFGRLMRNHTKLNIMNFVGLFYFLNFLVFTERQFLW